MKSLEALVEGLFDYAGMFPPAALTFQDALKEAAGFKDTLTRPSIVGADMVITAAQLNEATTQHMLEAGFHRGNHIRMCLVGTHASDGHKRASQILAYNRESRVDRVPHEVVALELHSEMDDPMDAAGALMPGRFVLSGQDIQVYWEPKLTDAEWNERFDEVWSVIDGCNSESELPIVGLKVRAAGEHALSPATLARIIPEINKRTLPFKVTQGLHHALAGTHDNPIGFIGLAAALRLNEEGALNAEQLEACITEADGAAFDWAGGISWRGHSIDRAQAGHAMRIPFQIGSCSISEPDQELDALWPALSANA